MPEPRHNKAIFKSSFSMGQYDFERFDKLLSAMDAFAVRVAIHDHTALVPLYSILWELYKNFRSIIFEPQRKKYEDKFKLVKSMIDNYSSANSELRKHGMNPVSAENSILRILDELQMDLLDIKQIIGLGLQVDKQEAFKTKIQRALGVSDD